MRKYSKEEVAEVNNTTMKEFAVNIKNEFENLSEGEGLFLAFNEWKFTTRPNNYFANYGIKMTCKKLETGWLLIKRVKEIKPI